VNTEKKVPCGELLVPTRKVEKAVTYSKTVVSGPCPAMAAMPKLLEEMRIEFATVTNTLVPKNHKNIFAGP